MNNEYIFDATDLLDIPAASRELFVSLKTGLQRIKDADKNIDDIAIVGGTLVDLLLGLNPNDIDIRYSYKEDGKLSNECHCSHIKQLAEKYFDKEVLEHGLELENVNEREPRVSFKESNLGLFTYPVDYICLFSLEADGTIWTNRDAFKCMKERTFEIRFEGWLIWLMFRDINNYFRIFSDSMVRGLSYVHKRHLKVGTKFALGLTHFPFILNKLAEDSVETKRYLRLFQSKIGGLEKLDLILREHQIGNREEIVQSMKSLIQASNYDTGAVN